ncbi:hypothetical protein NQ318_022899 [Aromia moschata]|uniref:Mos1 transposase HTH domain-containing protein n=1 Tax=Aromia moschata TaxID=1265417 RepID=A0AAV8XA66_9CUCU|nr:hypothetical protein NQ318_022899 [Aromia moschata]
MYRCQLGWRNARREKCSGSVFRGKRPVFCFYAEGSSTHSRLKFLVKLGKTFPEAYAMLKEVYGNECLSRTQVFDGFNGLKRDVKRPKIIRAPDGPQHKKRTKTLKKFVNQSAKIVV